MSIDYKKAYYGINEDYKKLVKTFDDKSDNKLLIAWLKDDFYRKSPEDAFTEGSERILAYHIKDLFERNNEGVSLIPLPCKLRTECKRCGSISYQD